MTNDDEYTKSTYQITAIGSFLTAITCIALIIYHVIDHVNNLPNIALLGFVGMASIGLMYYSIKSLIADKSIK